MGSRSLPSHGNPHADADRSDPFAAPRLFYYLGIVTISQLTFRLPGGFTVSDIFFFVSLLLAATLVLSTRTTLRDVIPKSGLWIGALMLTAGGLIASFAADHQLTSIATLLRLVYLTAIWFVLGAVVLVHRRHVEKAVWLWVISAAFTGLAALAQYMFGDIIPSTHVFFGRMTGFTQHVNDLGGVTSIALAPAAILALRRSGGPKRLAAVACVCLIAVGLLLSGSVGGMAAAGIATVVLVAATRAAGRLLVVLALIGLVGMAAFAVSTGNDVVTPLKRFAAATGSEGTQRDTLGLRVTTFKEAWRLIRADPFVGIGLGPENGTLRSGFEVHNMLLNPWLEAGLLGAAGMFLILSSVAGLVRRAARRAESRAEWHLTVSLGAACVALVAFGMGAPVLFQRYGWVSVALVIAMVASQRSGRPDVAVADRTLSATPGVL